MSLARQGARKGKGEKPMFAYEMKEAIEEAKTTLRGADEVANHIAQAIIGRLRSLDRSTLRRFKKQLQDFNMTTCEWKNK